MANVVVRKALHRTLRDVRHVRCVPPRRATGLVRRVYDQVERDFGVLAPPVALHSAAPDVLAASWVLLRESLLVSGGASRADREVVAAAVSRANACPYCVEVHGLALGSLGHVSAADAIAADDLGAIHDPAVRDLARWATGDGGAVPDGAVAGLSAVVTAFHYLNRVVNVFLDPQPLPPPARGLPAARTVLGRVLRPGPDVTPGASLSLLAPAGGDDVPSRALSAVAQAIDAAAAGVVPDRVRELVARELAAWDGAPPGLDQSWLPDALSTVSEVDRPVARLSLLTAKASYRVTDEDVAAVRALGTDDRSLVTTVSWAAWTAAASRVPRTAREEKTRAVASGDD